MGQFGGSLAGMKHFGSIIRDYSQGLRVGDPDVEQWHMGASREDPLGHGTTTSDGVWTLSTMCRGWRFGDVLVHFSRRARSGR